ncbi:MAG: ATP-dependent helicase HrpB [Opitutales bacterium]
MSRPQAENVSLPVRRLAGELVEALQRTNRVVLQAPTGSGKSTQVPQILLESGGIPEGQHIVVLQPRRLAARLLAKRVAHEHGSRLGEAVGYHIRFDRVFGPATRIKFVTEGILRRQILGEGNLNGIAAVIFDEFHERHLDGDLTLALARRLQEDMRPDLKLIIMSATLDTEALAAWLQPCQTLSAEGRAFPVDIRYAGSAPRPTQGQRPPAIWEETARHARALLAETGEGHVLIFMPGAYEIQRTLEALRQLPEAKPFSLHALHGELPPEAQDAAVSPSPQRRIIVSTNVAETSLTIDGVTLVIDSGLARHASYDPRRGINTLLTGPISQASAAQRAGRAGRTAAGTCLRLWSEKEHAHRHAREEPEIARVDLAETVLSLAAAGTDDLDTLNWLTPPPPEALHRATQLLIDLGALEPADPAPSPKETANGTLPRITETGRQLAAFPLHPRFARLFLEASRRRCLPTAARAAALAQGRDILLRLRDAREEDAREALAGETDSDFILRLRLWDKARECRYNIDACRQWGLHVQACRQADQLADQLLALARNQNLDTSEGGNPEDALRPCLLVAFADHLAKRLDRGTLRCDLVHNRRGDLRRESVARGASLLVAADLEEVRVKANVTILLGLATAVDEALLAECFPDAIRHEQTVLFDRGQKRVVARGQRTFRGLVLDARDGGDPPDDQAARLLADEAMEGAFSPRAWNDKVEAWLCRIAFAAQHCPELGISPVDTEARRLLFEQMFLGCVSVKEAREVDVWPTLRQWLTPEQAAALETLVPESFELPRRRKPVPVRYATDGTNATIASRLQNFYDVPGRSLVIAGGRYPLIIELLAPNGRPMQVTSDLDAFWQTSYPAVRKQLAGRYPKHEWR